MKSEVEYEIYRIKTHDITSFTKLFN
jgi:hypothetical protein